MFTEKRRNVLMTNAQHGTSQFSYEIKRSGNFHLYSQMIQVHANCKSSEQVVKSCRYRFIFKSNGSISILLLLSFIFH